MCDIRKIIKREMTRKRWRVAHLFNAMSGKRANGGDVPVTVIYDFLRGKSAINSTDLGLIFDALGLEVKPKVRRSRR